MDASPEVPTLMERIEEMSIDDDHPCSICFEYTSERNDAHFQCSLYSKEGGKCILCVACASQLRKLECPHCLGPISANDKFKQKYIDAITFRIEEDRKARRTEETIPPTEEEIQNALNSGIRNDQDVIDIPVLLGLLNNNINIDIVQPSAGSTEWDEMLGFASQLLMYGTEYNVVHEMMHRRFPSIGFYTVILCRTVDAIIADAQDMLEIE
jgi:hypothetical protein